MSYKLNAKNLVVARMIGRGKTANKRLKYLHVSRKGTTAITPCWMCRVSLPFKENQPLEAMIYPQRVIDSLKPIGDIPMLMPAGISATTTPEYIVPNIESLIPAPSEQTMSFTVNGETLARMLKVANKVNTSELKSIRIRYCPDRGVIRLDTFRKPGEQEFVGVIHGIEYSGTDIPGDAAGEKIPSSVSKQTVAALKISHGRKFRG